MNILYVLVCLPELACAIMAQESWAPKTIMLWSDDEFIQTWADRIRSKHPEVQGMLTKNVLKTALEELYISQAPRGSELWEHAMERVKAEADASTEAAVSSSQPGMSLSERFESSLHIRRGHGGVVESEQNQETPRVQSGKLADAAKVALPSSSNDNLQDKHAELSSQRTHTESSAPQMDKQKTRVISESPSPKGPKLDARSSSVKEFVWKACNGAKISPAEINSGSVPVVMEALRLMHDAFPTIVDAGTAKTKKEAQAIICKAYERYLADGCPNVFSTAAD